MSGKVPRRVAEKDRHVSRTGLSGAAKKGGAGGKGVWGKPGDEIDVEAAHPDQRDPLYSEFSDSEDYVLSEVDTTADQVLPLVKEYLVSGEVTDCLNSIFDLNLPGAYAQFIKQGILLACEKGAFERELMSRIVLNISDVEPAQVEEGFDLLMRRLPETKVDVPDALDMTAKFVARAIIDDALPPRFTEGDVHPNDDARECLHLARTQSLSKHAASRIEHVWGAGDMGSIKRLKKETEAVVREYVASDDLKEAERTLRMLNCPHFHFYVLKSALREAMVFPQHESKVLVLLKYLVKCGLISTEQATKGLNMVEEQLDDIKLDVPNAPTAFAHLKEKIKLDGWLPEDANSAQ